MEHMLQLTLPSGGSLRLVYPVADTMPRAIDSLSPAVVCLADPLYEFLHELRASFISLVKTLAKATDAETTALSNWIIDKSFHGGDVGRVSEQTAALRPTCRAIAILGMVFIDRREQRC
jgi:hypothetical protein